MDRLVLVDKVGAALEACAPSEFGCVDGELRDHVSDHDGEHANAVGLTDIASGGCRVYWPTCR